MNDDATLQDGKLQEIARRLGAGPAERLDVERAAQAVVTRLRTEPRAELRVLGWIRPAWLRIAAALVIVVGGAVLYRSTPGHRPVVSQHAAHFVADDLSGLSADDLRDVLSSFDEILSKDSAPASDSTDWRELDSQQLREVLRALEGEG